MTTSKKPRKNKPKDPLKYKAGNLRSSMRSRARRSGSDPEVVPSASEFRDWLEKQLPLTCYYTGEPVHPKDMQVDHLHPRSRGGTDTLDNLCVTSSGINRAKGNMTAGEFQSLLELTSKWPDKGATLLKRLKQAWRY